MPFSMKKHGKYIIGAGLLLAVAPPSFALFGVGDIVFDPTSYASLVSQLTTLESQYTMLKNNVTHFSAKQAWQTELTALKQANVANMFGETGGLSIALNTNSPTSSTAAWRMTSVAVSNNASSYLQGQTAGNSDQLSQLAMIEASDSISPDCITAIGQYHASRTQGTDAVAGLASFQLDTSDATNSEVQQLNLLNAAEAQKMAKMQAQGAMQACIAGQMTVANMQQRNADTSSCRHTNSPAHVAELASTLQLKDAHLLSQACNLTQLLMSLS